MCIICRVLNASELTWGKQQLLLATERAPAGGVCQKHKFQLNSNGMYQEGYTHTCPYIYYMHVCMDIDVVIHD